MIIDQISQYRRASHYNVTHRRRQNFYALPTIQWQKLSAPPFNILAQFDAVDGAIHANAEIAGRILRSGLEAFNIDSEPRQGAEDWRGIAKPSDMDKVHTTIRQFYRDWSAEGNIERKAAYSPVLTDLEIFFDDAHDKSRVKILVPGAGLGRLVFEICRLGYDVEGNEISYHQLLASSWILNEVQPHEHFDLYPFATTFSNHISRSHQLKAVKIPDVHPGTELLRNSEEQELRSSQRMRMTAADFVIMYGDEHHVGMFDAVVTVFFLDTAPNLLNYIQTIHNCLTRGGCWINLGPLLWHFEESGPADAARAPNPVPPGKSGTKGNAGIAEPGSIELTNEEVLLLVESMGFKIEGQEIRTADAGYIQDPSSMIQNLYRVSHWVARKIN